MRKYMYWFVLLLGISISCQKNETVGLEEDKGSPKGEPTFVVASYNILHDTEAISEHYQWSKRKELLIKQVIENEIDILCLQEDQTNQVADIQRATGLQVAGTAKRILYDGKRFSVRSQGRFYLSETPEKSSHGWDAAVIRLCNWALFNDRNTGRNFFVFNAHFDHIGVKAREKSALLMKERIDFMTNGQPVILTGDMNALPGSMPILTLTRFLNDSRAVSETAPEGPIGTYNGMNNDRAYEGRIDYVFTSSHFRVREYAVLQDETDGIFPSDHFPVITNVELK
ncbi:endonuclease/exonuclease/phosphatase family protein [Sphingobacterium gobiense]|uniref:Endonuclease n=1 Tax=Sphingobacterium gobiense TaxID=1382456 RepID=A0A2S9JL68_9SPHI|nr:endonuclease/exonuclease/phosphatase family protein [Sphingobacterium gobiense]PRD53858.1 endonuclease [Sphingobacterium gobiense]